MILDLITRKPVLDETSALWMFDTFAWALRYLDADVFFHETILVTPSNEHFPGGAGNAEELASLVFKRVKDYAGLGHWPCRLINEVDFMPGEPVNIQIEGGLRGSKGIVPATTDYAHTLAHYLGATAPEPPPGGRDNWPHVTELLAVFMGFGLMMANTAFTKKIRSCSSCSGPAVERTNYLSQYDVTYALAIFCVLKDIPAKQVLPHLKSTLRPFFKKAMKEVQGKEEEMAHLKTFNTARA
jgi:hypothetical protein